jgi:hypothetical protein
MGSKRAGLAPRLAAVSAAALAAALAGPLAAGAGASGAEVSYLGAGRVAWTGVAEVGEDGGSAGLSVFSPSYQNVESSDGSNVVAPGTSGELSVRVTNASGYAVGYEASAGLEVSDPDLPVEAASPAALSGTLEPGASVELSLPWSWGFSSGDAGDARDTALGGAAASGAAASASVSVSVAFEEPDGTVPRTGDASADGAALAASGLALALAGAALALRSRSGRRS